ncbi:hypothetical protein AB0C40_28420 [Streptomyces brevispora]|uniref:hypothetical protein n=1 Tax=Streptomyces brevispora TaxID=887462 RepID=UPI0033D82FBB
MSSILVTHSMKKPRANGRGFFVAWSPAVSHDHLDAVAAECKTRPRRTLGWKNPAERLTELLTTAV